MVAGAFPVAKLGILALKQISKPIANVIKNKAKQNDFFRRYVCMPPAQFYNWAEIKTKMWVMNLGKPTKIPQLNEAMAIELGANLLGEVIIFFIGASVLVLEYIRQATKEQKKEETTAKEKNELKRLVSELCLQLEMQQSRIQNIEKIIAGLETRVGMPLRSFADTKNGNGDFETNHKHTNQHCTTYINQCKACALVQSAFVWKALKLIGYC
uniref:Putative conserved plasma membrane protein n=1 Tax=Tabanus bromius TaxID=304241 RepID=A0A0K8TNQ2_TABBR